MSKSHFTEDQRKELITKLVTQFGNRVSKDSIIDFCSKHNLPNPHFLTSRRDIKSGKDYMLDLFFTLFIVGLGAMILSLTSWI